MDDNRTVVLCNEAAMRLLDRADRPVEGEHLADLLPELAEAVDAAVAGRMPAVADGGAVCCRSHTGSEIWLEFSVAPLAPVDGLLRGLVVAFRDVTDRRRAENELVRSQRLESLGVLAGGLAHDFNNLLTIILGNLSLVEMSDQLVAEDREQLAQVREATERAQGLTRQLLTFARGGAPRRRRTRLQDLIEPTVALSLSGAKVNWTCELADDLWTVAVDPGQIEQVLSNLLINAGQAMPDGGTVHVRAHNRELLDDAGKPARYVVVEIQDQGCGIADERTASASSSPTSLPRRPVQVWDWPSPFP